MNSRHFTELCQRFDLGEWLGASQPVSGGLIHRMWRIQTRKGSFAVKELNAQIMSKPNIREAYRRSERIAARMAAAGIPAATALSANNDDGSVQEINDVTVMVYDWIEGFVLAPGADHPAQTQIIGQILGQMHAANLDWTNLDIPDWNSDFDWRYADETILPQLNEWTAAYSAASLRLNRALVVSHRDLDQKNVLWRDPHSPVLIDWESAGLTNPVLELVTLALNWAGWHQTSPAETMFAAALSGYRSVYTPNIDAQAKSDALMGALGNLLGWLEFNLRRSSDQSSFSEDEQALGRREVATGLNGLHLLWDNFDLWMRWLDRYL